MTGYIVATSEAENPANQFYGHALIGLDLVLGAQGMEQYGTPIPPGHDGAYVTVAQIGQGETIIGTDGAGYAKLFLYEANGRWAVGRSLAHLANYVSTQRWALGIDETTLGSLRLQPGLIAQQLISSQTLYNEVRMLSPREEVHVDSNGAMRVRRREFDQAQNYAEALDLGLTELVGRLATLMASGIQVVSDITGGRDSRTVLAALRYAAPERLIGSNIRFRSNARQSRDYEVAQSLAKMSSFAINTKPKLPPSYRSAEGAFDLWRNHDLGVYYPVYPAAKIESEIALSGASGGAHRGVYKGDSLAASLDALRTPGIDNRLMSEIVERARHDANAEDPGSDEQLSHFRLFRNRIHGGRNPLRGYSLAPLASQSLNRASSVLDHTDLQSAQFYADVMFNLDPQLARHPYDQTHKAWGAEHRSRVTLVEMRHDRTRGKIYGERDPEVGESTPEADGYLQPYREAVVTASREVLESQLMPKSQVEKAMKSFDTATRMGFGHALDALPVHHVIHAAKALELCNY